MTKAELIAMLDGFQDNDEIVIAVPTHDYWNHTAGLPIHNAEYSQVRYSGYIESDQIVDPEIDDESDTRQVIVLS